MMRWTSDILLILKQEILNEGDKRIKECKGDLLEQFVQPHQRATIDSCLDDSGDLSWVSHVDLVRLDLDQVPTTYFFRNMDP